MSSSLRLDKLVAKCGFGSRAQARALIRSGLVHVDGEPVRDGGILIDPCTTEVKVAGQTLNYSEYHYYMLNKPAGVLSATRDSRQPTVIELLPKTMAGLKLFPVGRLDKDTRGLLLLTNDGNLAHGLLAPKKGIPKIYRALIDGMVGKADVAAFAAGIPLADFTALPADLTVLTPGTQTQVQVTLFEGKFHQVKRMFRARGFTVLDLERVAMGPIKLDPLLSPGKFRPLTKTEQVSLQEAIK